ncbi:MAG TPA: cellulose binding domain-containing protein [Acidimicrobiales bacterium]|nr:cellulose binding domain-containing protein [Acidimicrobiales bacterium]
MADLDLRSALRPMVDQPARAPLPVGDLAQRARRHRLRRRSAVAALALVAVVGMVGTLAAQDSPSRVTTTNAPPPAGTPDSPTPSEPSTSVTTSPAPAPTPAPTPDSEAEPTSPPPPSTDEGIVTTVTTTSSWDRGHCVEVRVENTTTTPVTWEVGYTPAGTIATLWNATTSTSSDTFTGEPWNATLAPTEWTTFGICVDT